MPHESSISPTVWQHCLETLQAAIDDPECVPDLETLERLAAKVSKQARKRRRKIAGANLSEAEWESRKTQSRNERRANRQKDRTLVDQSGIPRVHQGETLQEQTGRDTIGTLRGKSKRCYGCGVSYREIHSLYHAFCPECAETQEKKRLQRTDLAGRYALVTGGRIKIGFQTALKLLRDGATVLVTTRFPRDAAERFAAQTDFDEWRQRLHVYGLDFLHVPDVLEFVSCCERQWPALDILINNAAQSVRRPPEFYAPALEREQQPLNALPEAVQALLARPEMPGPLPETSLESLQEYDRHGQPLDTREQNSWTLRLHEVQPRELLETLVVNAAVPCLLTAQLKPLFLRSIHPERFIINVGGLDGQFGRPKGECHPHVNMSKAALNMMTRTSAEDYARDGIYMNSVDTGWITHETGFSKRERMRNEGFYPPLDEVDGAARIYDPIVRGLTGDADWGKIFRHYQPAEW